MVAFGDKVPKAVQAAATLVEKAVRWLLQPPGPAPPAAELAGVPQADRMTSCGLDRAQDLTPCALCHAALSA